jgi:hypothetical protein
MAHAPKQDHNHNLDSIALNNLCFVSRLRVVSYSRTRCRKSETREQNYLLSIMPMQVYNTPFRSRMGTGPPSPPRRPGACHRRFFSLVVGAPKSPHRLLGGLSSMFLIVDGGRSRISSTTSHGDRHRCFLALMVGAPGSLALPPRGSVVDVS